MAATPPSLRSERRVGIGNRPSPVSGPRVDPGESIESGAPRSDTSASRILPDALVATAYERLRRIAMTMLATERDGHTLEPTALVNEAIRRILTSEGVSVASNEHLNRLVTVVMRRVLIDHARSYRSRVRRESGVAGTSSGTHLSLEDADDLVALHEAVSRMRRTNPRRADVLTNYYFGGLSTAVIAETLGVSQRTVQLELALGRHALRARIDHAAGRTHAVRS